VLWLGKLTLSAWSAAWTPALLALARCPTVTSRGPGLTGTKHSQRGAINGTQAAVSLCLPGARTGARGHRAGSWRTSAAAVLAVLLLAEGRQVSLGALVDALWGQEPPKAAAGTVRTYVSRLRHCLKVSA